MDSYVQDGKRKWCGGKDLKASQHYSQPFGQAIKKLHLKHKKGVERCMAKLRADARFTSNAMRRGDKWTDAKIDTVLGYLSS